jgi:hypothetical protein
MHAQDPGTRKPFDMSTPPFPDMDELLQRLLDDQLEPEEMERLQKAMREDPRVREYYVDSLFTCGVIRRSSQVTGELSESDLIQALSDGESRGVSKRVGRHLYSIAAILMLGVLVLASLSLFRHRDQGSAIGTLVGAYEAQWKGARPRPGEPLRPGRYDLRDGLAKMELGGGTSLLLEAPCQIELKSTEEVTLRSGRLATTVPPQARGFRVRTPTALITDLGTEFGVIAHSDGSTEAHVLKGHISVALDPNRAARAAPLVVNEGLAVAVDPNGRTIRGGLAARADLFVLLLQLPSSSQPAGPARRVNLADLVGGGDGRGAGTLDQGVDLGTGQAFGGPATAIRETRQNAFHPTPQLRGINGVFIPTGALAPLVISSTGLIFSECPPTLGSYYGGPVNSGKFYDLPSKQIHVPRLNGITYGTSSHPALTLHPNAGITFDLDQIRQDHPDLPFARFTAVCSIPKDLPQTQFSSADVWVLLDGAVRLHLRYPPDRHVLEKVDLPIPPRTRFLTLVSTCTGRADYSWIFFGDPFLEPAAPVQAEATR